MIDLEPRESVTVAMTATVPPRAANVGTPELRCAVTYSVSTEPGLTLCRTGWRSGTTPRGLRWSMKPLTLTTSDPGTSC